MTSVGSGIKILQLRPNFLKMTKKQIEDYFSVIGEYSAAERNNEVTEEFVERIYANYPSEIIMLLLNQGFFLTHTCCN